MNSLDVEFLVASEDATLVCKFLSDEKADRIEQFEDEGFLPVVGVVVAAVIAVKALANVIIKLSRLWKSGVIVDARGPVIQAKKAPNLPRGTILVFSDDGTRHELSQPSTLELASLIQKGD
jgi:hypothetical protein